MTGPRVDLSPWQRDVLRTLAVCGALSPSKSRLYSSTVARRNCIDNLERRGLVVRMPDGLPILTVKGRDECVRRGWTS